MAFIQSPSHIPAATVSKHSSFLHIILSGWLEKLSSPQITHFLSFIFITCGGSGLTGDYSALTVFRLCSQSKLDALSPTLHLMRARIT